MAENGIFLHVRISTTSDHIAIFFCYDNVKILDFHDPWGVGQKFQSEQKVRRCRGKATYRLTRKHHPKKHPSGAGSGSFTAKSCPGFKIWLNLVESGSEKRIGDILKISETLLK